MNSWPRRFQVLIVFAILQGITFFPGRASGESDVPAAAAGAPSSEEAGALNPVAETASVVPEEKKPKFFSLSSAKGCTQCLEDGDRVCRSMSNQYKSTCCSGTPTHDDDLMFQSTCHAQSYCSDNLSNAPSDAKINAKQYFSCPFQPSMCGNNQGFISLGPGETRTIEIDSAVIEEFNEESLCWFQLQTDSDSTSKYGKPLYRNLLVEEVQNVEVAIIEARQFQYVRSSNRIEVITPSPDSLSGDNLTNLTSRDMNFYVVITPLSLEDRQEDFSVKFTFSHYEHYNGFLQEQAALEAEQARQEMLKKLKEECEAKNIDFEDTNSTKKAQYIWDDDLESCLEKSNGGDPSTTPDPGEGDDEEPQVVLDEDQIRAKRLSNFKAQVAHHDKKVHGGRQEQTFHYVMMIMIILFSLVLYYLLNREEQRKVYFAKNKIKKSKYVIYIDNFYGNDELNEKVKKVIRADEAQLVVNNEEDLLQVANSRRRSAQSQPNFFVGGSSRGAGQSNPDADEGTDEDESQNDTQCLEIDGDLEEFQQQFDVDQADHAISFESKNDEEELPKVMDIPSSAERQDSKGNLQLPPLFDFNRAPAPPLEQTEKSQFEQSPNKEIIYDSEATHEPSKGKRRSPEKPTTQLAAKAHQDYRRRGSKRLIFDETRLSHENLESMKLQSKTVELDEEEQSFRNGSINEEATLLAEQTSHRKGGEIDNFLIEAQMAKKKTNIKNTVNKMMKSALKKAKKIGSIGSTQDLEEKKKMRVPSPPKSPQKRSPVKEQVMTTISGFDNTTQQTMLDDNQLTIPEIQELQDILAGQSTKPQEEQQELLSVLYTQFMKQGQQEEGLEVATTKKDSPQVDQPMIFQPEPTSPEELDQTPEVQMQRRPRRLQTQPNPKRPSSAEGKGVFDMQRDEEEYAKHQQQESVDNFKERSMNPQTGQLPTRNHGRNHRKLGIGAGGGRKKKGIGLQRYMSELPQIQEENDSAIADSEDASQKVLSLDGSLKDEQLLSDDDDLN